MKVREIMTTDVVTATLDTTLDQIAGMMRDQDAGAIPILDDDELVGIITDRDIVVRCIAEGKDPSATSAEEVLLEEELETISPDVDAEEAARLMASKQVRRLPVVEDEVLVGIISLGDISAKGEPEAAGKAFQDVSQGVKKAPQASGRGKKLEQPRQPKVAPARAQGKNAAKRRRAG